MHVAANQGSWSEASSALRTQVLLIAQAQLV